MAFSLEKNIIIINLQADLCLFPEWIPELNSLTIETPETSMWTFVL